MFPPQFFPQAGEDLGTVFIFGGAYFEGDAGYALVAPARPVNLTASLDAALQISRSASASLGAVISAATAAQVTLSAAVQALGVKAQTNLEVLVSSGVLASSDLSVAVQSAVALLSSVDAALRTSRSLSASLDVRVVVGRSVAAVMDAAMAVNQEVSASLDSAISVSKSAHSTLDAVAQGTVSRDASLTTALQSLHSASVELDAMIVVGGQAQTALGAAVQSTAWITSQIDAAIAAQRFVTGIGLSAVVALPGGLSPQHAAWLELLARAHGLIDGLQVSLTQRSDGSLVQTINESSGVVTVQTITGPSGDPGTSPLTAQQALWLERLVRLYAGVDPYSVTETSRGDGTLTQTLSTSGSTVTVGAPT